MKLDCVRNTVVKLVEKYYIEALAMYVQLVCLWHQWIHGCANSPLGQAPKTCAKLFIPPAKTTLPNNFQTMNISKLSGAQCKREKKSVTINGGSNGYSCPFAPPPRIHTRAIKAMWWQLRGLPLVGFRQSSLLIGRYKMSSAQLWAGLTRWNLIVSTLMLCWAPKLTVTLYVFIW